MNEGLDISQDLSPEDREAWRRMYAGQIMAAFAVRYSTAPDPDFPPDLESSAAYDDPDAPDSLANKTARSAASSARRWADALLAELGVAVQSQQNQAGVRTP